MKYQFIQEQQGQFSLTALCRVMQVAHGGYYAWRKRPARGQEQASHSLLEQIKAVHAEGDQTYGSPRVYEELKKQGITCSEKRIARLMQRSHLYAVTVKRFVVTTDSNHALPLAENLLDREFSAQTPNARWAADITYIWPSKG